MAAGYSSARQKPSAVPRYPSMGFLGARSPRGSWVAGKDEMTEPELWPGFSVCSSVSDELRPQACWQGALASRTGIQSALNI